MKQEIHPKYDKTIVKCNSCGNTFETRSTIPEITVEICSNCHPFYTGKQKLVDTAGRVDKFNARRAKATIKDNDTKTKLGKKVKEIKVKSANKNIEQEEKILPSSK